MGAKTPFGTTKGKIVKGVFAPMILTVVIFIREPIVS
jgi:hypothetical protein